MAGVERTVPRQSHVPYAIALTARAGYARQDTAQRRKPHGKCSGDGYVAKSEGSPDPGSRLPPAVSHRLMPLMRPKGDRP